MLVAVKASGSAARIGPILIGTFALAFCFINFMRSILAVDGPQENWALFFGKGMLRENAPYMNT